MRLYRYLMYERVVEKRMLNTCSARKHRVLNNDFMYLYTNIVYYNNNIYIIRIAMRNFVIYLVHY